jgi:3-dehydroquinate dehydratase-1
MALLTTLKALHPGAPCLAVAVTDEDSPELLKAYDAPYPLCVELRGDLCASQDPAHLCRILQSYRPLPRLLTLRSAQEGGEWRKSEAQRLEVYLQLLDEVEGVDIELSADNISQELIQVCKKAGKSVILSFHDFKNTPDRDTLETLLQRGLAMGADVVKIAARCNSPEDLIALTHFLVSHPDENLIVLGMGNHGVSSRLFFPALGSLLSYTFIGKPSAPGQYNLDQMLHLFDAIYPCQ